MLKKIIETVTGSLDAKKEYKLYKKRVNGLPSEYKNAMLGIQTYMQNFGSLDGKEIYDILDMLEIAVADGRKVTDVIGKDIESFCEDVIKAVPKKTWINSYKQKVTKKISKQMDKRAK
jgi:DNA-binding ferritin-like protein (Dps family)